jgi:hypothetical protein
MTIAADPRHLGARVGMTSVLHTWGSAMTHHPHTLVWSQADTSGKIGAPDRFASNNPRYWANHRFCHCRNDRQCESVPMRQGLLR